MKQLLISASATFDEPSKENETAVDFTSFHGQNIEFNEDDFNFRDSDSDSSDSEENIQQAEEIV